MSTDTDAIKTVKGPKAAVATFVKPSDQKRIYVFKRDRETREQALARVMRRNGAAGGEYEWCN